MNSHEKFKELVESYVPVIDLDQFVSGDFYNGAREGLGEFELKETTNEYDFDGQADLTSVYYFKDLDLYVKFYGYYRSYDGTHFTKYEFVSPIIKQVTCYE